MRLGVTQRATSVSSQFAPQRYLWYIALFTIYIHICMSMENVCLFSSNRSQVLIFVVFVVVGYYCLLLLNVLPSTFWLLTADCFQHIGCCCCHFFCAIFHYSTACCVLFVAPCYCCCRFRASVLNLQMFSCIAAISFRVHALTDTNICLCMCVRMHILCTVKQAQVAITAFL